MTFDVLFDDHHNGNYDNDYGVVDDDDAATAIATEAYEGKANGCACVQSLMCLCAYECMDV